MTLTSVILLLYQDPSAGKQSYLSLSGGGVGACETFRE